MSERVDFLDPYHHEGHIAVSGCDRPTQPLNRAAAQSGTATASTAFSTRATAPPPEVESRIGTRHASAAAALSFSLGMQVGITAFNAALGVAALALLFGTIHPVAALRSNRSMA